MAGTVIGIIKFLVYCSSFLGLMLHIGVDAGVKQIFPLFSLFAFFLAASFNFIESLFYCAAPAIFQFRISRQPFVQRLFRTEEIDESSATP